MGVGGESVFSLSMLDTLLSWKYLEASKGLVYLSMP